jgi:hypothetical protein
MSRVSLVPVAEDDWMGKWISITMTTNWCTK